MSLAEDQNNQNSTGMATPGAAAEKEAMAVSSDSEKGQAEAISPASPRTVHGVKWILIVVAILSCTTLFALDNTVVADIQSPVIHQFGAVDKLPWLSVGYLLGSTSTNLLWYVICPSTFWVSFFC
jgi:hypothetical protein